jgi:biotin-dependent carboxylase-like uncharacterized protein
MTLRVLDAGLHTLLVDYGRPASRSLGVPVGGAADRISLALGNALVGNPPDAPALEMALAGPTLLAQADVGAVVFGAPFELSCGGQALNVGRTFSLRAGESLRVTGTRLGMRAYLCVAGGFTAPEILGSRSGLEPIRSGLELFCPESTLGVRFLDETAPSSLPASDLQVLRVLSGAQADWFDQSAFLGQTFQVAPASNRMGLRLQGTPLPRPARDILSEPVCPGTVQVTNDGQCIILGIDGQTIGGYPKIAQVIQADLDLLAQLRPGFSVRFAAVNLAEAEQAFRYRQAVLDEWLTRIKIGIDCSGIAESTSL